MKRIGIIGAMEKEIMQLRERVPDAKIINKASMKFYQGKMFDHEIIIVKSGIGKVNASICTQVLIDLFQVDIVINTGIAGSLDNEIEIGDIVISTETMQYDLDLRELGYALGQVPGLDNVAFKASPTISELAHKLCKEVNADISVFLGRIASGDQFVADPILKGEINKNFNALCVEMEGAAIGQTAYLNNIPFVIIRSISDKADNGAKLDFSIFENESAIRSSRLVEKLIEKFVEC